MHKRAKSNFIYFSKKHALDQSITISFIVSCILVIGTLHGQADIMGASWLSFLKFFLWHFLRDVLLYYMLFRLNFKIIRSDTKYTTMPWVAIVGTIFICLLFSPMLSQTQWYIMGVPEKYQVRSFVFFNLAKDFIMGLIVILVTRYIHANYKREQIIIANQKLIEENIRTRFEALKNQLDPHFLFNSLNTLNGLIGIDDEKAQEYVDNLSSVFRYTLNNKDIQTLNGELEFVGSYIALLKIRYGKNLIVEYDIEERYRDFEIMPISIQLLVENAVKHNVISNKSPLTIKICTTPQESISVSNRINPKLEESINSGVGLANLADRYEILFKKSISINNENGIFNVEIPLIADEKGGR